MTGGPLRAPLATLAILAVAIVGVLGVLPSLASPDLNWCYPFMGPDSWDWLVNGLYWSGAPVQASFRPPGLPLVIALLHRLAALPLLPYLNFAMLGLAAFLLHRLVRLRHSSVVAALAVLLFVSNGSLFGYTRFVMAEVWTLPFLIVAAIAFIRAAERPRSYLLCAFLLSVSFLFHYAGAVVGVGLGLAVLLYRREILFTRWPWLALAVASPLPASWMVVREIHNRSSENSHLVVGLVRPSLENSWYYAVVATALVSLVALPLYVAGFARLFPRRGSRLAPWAQAVLLPFLALAIFFVLVYSWADKRFLYYLFPFALAIASEGVALIVAWGRRGRWQAASATLLLLVVALWNRIPYPAGSHRLLALTPRNFLDAAEGLHSAKDRSVAAAWSAGLLATDGFLSFQGPPLTCMSPLERAATPQLRSLLAEHLEPAAPIAFAGRGGDATAYWVDTNRLTLALERPVVKPGGPRYVLRRLEEPDPHALTTVGPWEVFDLADKGIGHQQRRRKQRPKTTPQQLPAAVSLE